MSKLAEALDPADISPEDIDSLEQVLSDHPSLVGREGFKLALPDPIFHLLLQIVNLVRKGSVVTLISADETMTTKAAAEFLGVSRPFLCQLLDKGELPFHRVGSHRRIRFGDLKEYRDARDQSRHKRLEELFRKVKDAGHYDDVNPKE